MCVRVTRGADRSLHIARWPRPWDAAAPQAPLMTRNVTAPKQADARPLEDVVTELARLTA